MKPVTAKIRMGFERDDNVTIEAAKGIEAALRREAISINSIEEMVKLLDRIKK